MLRLTTSASHALVVAPGFVTVALYASGHAPAIALTLLAVLAIGVFAPRWGMSLAFASVAVGLPWLFLAAMIASFATGISIVHWMTAGVTLAVVVIASIKLRQRPPHAVDRVRVMSWVPAGVGTLTWFAGLGWAHATGQGQTRAWAMMGDAANNILMARELLLDNGADITTPSNMVPLPHVLAVTLMAPSRGGLSGSALFDHDLGAFVTAWSLGIGSSCLAAGVLALTLVRRSPLVSRRAQALVAAVASLLPLSWLFTGYPIEFGFYNGSLALVLICVSVIAHLEADRRPAVAAVVLLLAFTLALALWSPIATVPLALGVSIAMQFRQQLLASSRTARVVLVAGAFQAFLYSVLIEIPIVLASGSGLSSGGGVLNFPHAMLPVLALAVTALVLVAFRPTLGRAGLTIVMTSASLLISLAVLLKVSGSTGAAWTYYPSKFAWLATCLLLIVAVAAWAALLGRVAKRWLRVLAGLSWLLRS